jgi:hypothetical protein
MGFVKKFLQKWSGQVCCFCFSIEKAEENKKSSEIIS